MTGHALEIHDLHAAYGSLHVLRGITLDVAAGEVFGLLGPNGAGKTTLVHTILGLLRPKRGTVRVWGSHAHGQVNTNVGYLPERQRYHGHVTGREYLMTLGRLSGMRGQELAKRVNDVLGGMELLDAANRRLGTYSKGMLQRIGLAQAVLHDPDLLIIDEPTSGLDPAGQSEMITLLQQFRQAGHTIFMCTHHLGQVTSLCDRVGVLVNGQINHLARVADLEAEGQRVEIDVDALPQFTAAALESLGPQVRTDRTGVTLFPANDQIVAAVLRRLLDDNVAVRAVTPHADALQQFYIQAVDPAFAATLPTANDPATTDTLLEDR